MSAFPWDDLFPEMKQEVRARLDLLTGRLLAYTCKAEHKAAPSWADKRRYCMAALFGKAAKVGSLAICQWVFDVTTPWTTSAYQLPYHSQLDVGKALRYGQTHVLDWAIEKGLPRADYALCRKFQGQNNLASLKWLIAHGHACPREILPEMTNMDVVLWLLEQQPAISVHADALRYAFLNLPRSKERFLCFLAQTGSTLPFNLVFHAINRGRWEAVAFVEQHMPAVIEAIGAKWPAVGLVIASRSSTDTYINTETGIAYSREAVPDVGH